jgi:hypothetical protein
VNQAVVTIWKKNPNLGLETWRNGAREGAWWQTVNRTADMDRREFGDRVKVGLTDENNGPDWLRFDAVIARAIASRPGTGFADFLMA